MTGSSILSMNTNMKWTLFILCVGDLIDTFASLYLISIGYQELNPIMSPLLEYPFIFVAVKLLTLLFATVLFWYAREMKTAIIASRIVSIYYAVIAVYYVIFLMMI